MWGRPGSLSPPPPGPLTAWPWSLSIWRPSPNSGQVLPAIATAVGVKTADGGVLTKRVARMLRGITALLVLDNFEHVLGAAADLDRLLGAVDDSTRVLVTSRARLGLADERVFALEPLATKPRIPPSARDHAQTAEPAAVTLFRERASSAHPGALAHSDPATSASSATG